MGTSAWKAERGSVSLTMAAFVAAAVVMTACSASGPDAATPTSTTTTTASESTTSIENAADVVLVDAHVITMDEADTIAEAIAIDGDEISFVGSSEEVAERIGSGTIVLSLDGRTVMPGFVDPHTHLLQDPAPDLDAMLEMIGVHLVHGTTTTGVPSIEPEELEAFRQLDASGELVIRTHLYPLYNTACGERPYGDFHLAQPFDRDPSLRLAIAGVKVFADGGVCGAPAISFPYPDTVAQPLKDAGWVGTGTLFVESGELASLVEAVDTAGGTTVVHAIGDVALRTALAGYEQAAESTGGFAHPQRLDHNSLVGRLTPEELGAYGRAGIFPVVQLSPFANACEEGRPELWESVWPPDVLAQLEDRRFIADANPGIRFAWHGDNPWIPGTPFEQMYSVTHRRAVDPESGAICQPPGWDSFPTETVADAIRMMTVNAAAAMGIDEQVGSLEPGKVADLLVLRADPFGDDPEESIARNGPLFTMIGGKAAFCDPELCELIRPLDAVP